MTSENLEYKARVICKSIVICFVGLCPDRIGNSGELTGSDEADAWKLMFVVVAVVLDNMLNLESLLTERGKVCWHTEQNDVPAITVLKFCKQSNKG